jgi:hypothetical protein
MEDRTIGRQYPGVSHRRQVTQTNGEDSMSKNFKSRSVGASATIAAIFGCALAGFTTNATQVRAASSLVVQTTDGPVDGFQTKASSNISASPMPRRPLTIYGGARRRHMRLGQRF